MNPIENLLAAVEDHMKATGDGTWKPLIDAVREQPVGVVDAATALVEAVRRAPIVEVRIGATTDSVGGTWEGDLDKAICTQHFIPQVDALSAALSRKAVPAETPKGIMLSRAELENIRVQIRGAGLSDMAINAGHLISHIDALNSELADRICIAKSDLSADQLVALADLLDDIWDGRDTDAEMLRDMARELEDESEADDESEEGHDDEDVS
jgi:hypothetical protein